MPSVGLIVIQETDGGISIDQIPLQNGTPMERQFSKIIDIGLKASQEYIMQQVSKAGDTGAIEIEGEHCEAFINEKLKDMGAVNYRKLLADAGYKLP